VVTPKPYPLPGFVVPLLPFSKGMWLAVTIYVIIATLLLYGLSKTTDRLLGKYHALAQKAHLVYVTIVVLFIRGKSYCDDIFASRRTSHACPQPTFPSHEEQHTAIHIHLPASSVGTFILRDTKRT
jgi:hypothetical protein